MGGVGRDRKRRGAEGWRIRGGEEGEGRGEGVEVE